MDEREEEAPLVKTGQNFMEQEKWDEAEKAFKQALVDDPMMARPHLDLALLYQQYKPNYIYAIYHYDRYVELRPDSEKTEFIKEQRSKILQAMANTIIKNSPQIKQMSTDLELLKQENAVLKQQLAAAQSVTKIAISQSDLSTSSEPTTPQTGLTATNKIYTVLSGDTLTKIATKFYGDSSKWDVILKANNDTLNDDPRLLKAGQTLVIPSPVR